MGILELDFSSLFNFTVLACILLGTFVGIFFGSVPGLGSTITIVLLLPISYMVSPIAAILMLLAAYQAAEYGGSISSIILGIPGTPAAVATTLDGHTYAKKESPGKALSYSLYASFIGGLFGALVLIFLSKPLVTFALKIGAAEFTLIGLLGLLAVATLSSKSVVKSLIAGVLGLMAGTVGMDLFTGISRYTMGRVELIEGVSIIALVVGIFGVSELLTIISESLNKTYVTDSKKLNSKLSVKEIKKVSKFIGIGSVTGSAVGIFPGTGAGTASWFSYSLARKFSKNKDEFGKGNPEGIVAPESANNATVGGALLPLLALGIPGSPTIAIIMGAFIIHGIQPGPTIFAKQPELVNSIFIGFLLTTFVLLIMGKLLTPLFARVLTIPNSILVPAILTVSMIGVFANQSMFFDLWFALIIGVVAFIMKKLDFSLPSFILAFVLCPIIEENFRRAITLSDGSYLTFVTRPISLVITLIILSLFISPLIKMIKKKKLEKTSA